MLDLLWLSFPLHLLQVHEFADVGMGEDVVTTFHARQTESKGAGKSAGLLKSKIGGRRQGSLK